MATMSFEYLGELRVKCKHESSGAIIYTDAPVDNHGKGESFSPTDLCAGSLAACALTIMGVYAQTHNVDIVGATAEVNKIMSENPRQIGKIEFILNMPDKNYSDKEKISLARAMEGCPVKITLANVEQEITINWAK